MSEERKNEITTHKITTSMYYMEKEDVMDSRFKMEINSFIEDKMTIATLAIPYIKEQLKNHLKMELCEDMKAYKKAIRTMLKEIKRDELYQGFSSLNNCLRINSNTREVSDQEFKAIELNPFHKNNIVRPLTWNEFNLSEDVRRKKLMKELNS